MSHVTKEVELRAGAPVAFDGNIRKASRWLHSVKAYFTVNAAVYSTDEKKVVTALAYMTEGTASSWSDTFYQVCEGRISKYVKEEHPSMELGPISRKNFGRCLSLLMRV
jgi:hypothetical protein